MTLSIETTGDVWVGQLWTAENNRLELLRVTIVDPHLGLVEFVDETEATAVQSTPQFLATHRRLQGSPKLTVELRSAGRLADPRQSAGRPPRLPRETETSR